MAAKRKPTIAAGAVIERSLVVRWARRCIHGLNDMTFDVPERAAHRAGMVDALNDLIDWLKSQPQRTRRAGGIGR